MRCQNYKPLAFLKPALNFGIGGVDKKKSEEITRKKSFRKKFYIPSAF